MESQERTRKKSTSVYLCRSNFFPFFLICGVVFFFFLIPCPSATALSLFGQSSRPVVHSQQYKSSTHRHDLTSTFADFQREREDDDDDENNNNIEEPIFDQYIQSFIPPPPEDQFMMTGDVTVLFLYAFTSHYLNNFVVDSVISHSNSIQDAVNALDPMGEITNLQQPVWVSIDEYDMTQNVLTLTAKDCLMNHWGPLFSTVGSASVALCTCWLLAGWWHRAFLFQNTVECDTGSALIKTIQTWLSMALLMILLTMGWNELITHFPPVVVDGASVHTDFGSITAGATVVSSSAAVDHHHHVDYIMTKADSMFLIDSMTVLISWRFMANTFIKNFL